MPHEPLTNPVDFIKLAGVDSPGIAEVIGAGNPRTYDERKGFGFSGAFVVFKGNKLSHFQVKIRLYTPEEWAAWRLFSSMLRRPPMGERPKALSIWHPQLEDCDIKAVVIEDCDAGEQTADGEWTFTIKMIEFRKPQVGLAKPEAAAAEPLDPVDAKIQELVSQATALAGPPPPPLPVPP